MHKLSFFIFVWALSKVSQILAVNDFFYIFPNKLPCVFFACSIFLTLIKPSSLLFFSLMAFSQILATLQRAPAVGNHMFFGMFVEISFLGILIYYLIREGKVFKATSEMRDRIFDGFSNGARYILIVFYSVALLHKLNWGFFDPSVSCATRLFLDIRNVLQIVPDNAVTRYMSIYGTLFFEGCIPLLLLFRKTTNLAMLFALFAHFVWGFLRFGGISDFSFMAYSLYVLLLPHSWYKEILSILKNLSQRVRLSPLRIAFACIFLGILIISYLSYLVRPPLTVDGRFFMKRAYTLTIIGMYYWYVFATVFIATYSVLLYRFRTKFFEPHDANFLKNPVLALPALIIVVLGITPYLGYRTVPSLSMFSNLQTSTKHWNHLFLPSNLKVVGWEEDLVEIESTTSPILAVLGMTKVALSGRSVRPRMPYLGLVSWLSIYDSEATFFRNGERKIIRSRSGKVFDDVGNELHPSVIANRLLAFREVEDTEKPRCNW
jgi:hypothetical protein